MKLGERRKAAAPVGRCHAARVPGSGDVYGGIGDAEPIERQPQHRVPRERAQGDQEVCPVAIADSSKCTLPGTELIEAIASLRHVAGGDRLSEPRGVDRIVLTVLRPGRAGGCKVVACEGPGPQHT